MVAHNARHKPHLKNLNKIEAWSSLNLNRMPGKGTFARERDDQEETIKGTVAVCLTLQGPAGINAQLTEIILSVEG
jgi:hypothetical protein